MVHTWLSRSPCHGAVRKPAEVLANAGARLRLPSLQQRHVGLIHAEQCGEVFLRHPRLLRVPPRLQRGTRICHAHRPEYLHSHEPAASVPMTYVIKEVGTVEAVSDTNRRYDEDCARHARKIIREFVDKHGTEQAAAAVLGVHQSTI